MRLFCALLPFLIAACGRADATETNLPALTVEFFQADSSRVIARWSRPCDARGCADSYRVQWTAGGATALRNTAALTDTLRVRRPAIGDTLAVSVAVTSVRRGLAGATRTATAVVRNPDAPPPPVDSLRADTVAGAYELALADTFPVWVVRDSLGQQPPRQWQQEMGSDRTLCLLARNRYTGDVTILVAGDAPPDAEAWLAQHCETARQLYAAERDG